MAPHCAGAALDLTLIDADGVELDIGGAVNGHAPETRSTVRWTPRDCPTEHAAIATSWPEPWATPTSSTTPPSGIPSQVFVFTVRLINSSSRDELAKAEDAYAFGTVDNRQVSELDGGLGGGPRRVSGWLDGSPLALGYHGDRGVVLAKRVGARTGHPRRSPVSADLSPQPEPPTSASPSGVRR